MKKSYAKTHISRYGPIYLTCLSVPLVMADLTRHVLQDNGILGPSASMFRNDCPYKLESFECLTVVGWLVSVVCTYLGYICLFWGVLWCADMHIKIRHAWISKK